MNFCFKKEYSSTAHAFLNSDLTLNIVKTSQGIGEQIKMMSVLPSEAAQIIAKLTAIVYSTTQRSHWFASIEVHIVDTKMHVYLFEN